MKDLAELLEALGAALRSESAAQSASAPWQAMAYAKLGAVRDSMTPEAVEVVQDFIGPIASTGDSAPLERSSKA